MDMLKFSCFHKTMRKGFSIPLVLIFIVVFLSVPLLYWFFSSRDGTTNVMGATTNQLQQAQNGFSVRINSKDGTWDLYEYLCTTKDECASSLMSGRRVQIVSGGTVQNHDVAITSGSDWNSYKYAKVFVRSGWGSSAREFKVESVGVVPGSERVNFTYESANYKAVLIPLDSAGDSFYKSAVFSD
jgi:hypothetical protein